MLHVEVDWVRLRVGGLLRGDFAIFQHGVEHEVATLEGAVGMQDGRIGLRAFGQGQRAEPLRRA